MKLEFCHKKQTFEQSDAGTRANKFYTEMEQLANNEGKTEIKTKTSRNITCHKFSSFYQSKQRSLHEK